MRNILVLGLLAALTVVAVESLECQKCVSFPPYIDNCGNDGDDGDVAPSECPEEAGAVSCGYSAASWPVDGELKSYHEKFCSGLPAGTSLSFAVRATGQQRVLFANEQCEEACDPTLPEDFPVDVTGNTQCPTCIKFDQNSCDGEPQTCNDGERCVDLLAELSIGGDPQLMTLKGCSNINDTACNLLSEGNVTVGDITFKHLECTPPNPISTSEPTRTPDSNTTSNSSSSSDTTTSPSTTSSSGLSQAAKLPWIASLVLGLLLL